jgi:hypothetical protein
MNKLYLGDNVFVEYTEDGLVKLYFDNGHGPYDMILLEPEVWENLKLFMERVTRTP